MARIGRPPVELDRKAFESLCKLQCTESEICSFFGVTDKTLVRWIKRTYSMTYSEAYKRFSQDGLISLRRLQFKHAEKSAAMAIFLGKQYLGQRDVVEQSGETGSGVTIVNNIPR